MIERIRPPPDPAENQRRFVVDFRFPIAFFVFAPIKRFIPEQPVKLWSYRDEILKIGRRDDNNEGDAHEAYDARS